MNNHILNPDTQAALLLCGNLGQAAEAGVKPLTLSEYNRLMAHLLQRGMRPSDLLTPFGVGEISGFSHKNITPDRVALLLSRGVSLAFAVEEWEKRGIRVLGRSDENYPHRLKSRLKGSAPAILYFAGNPELLNSGGLAIVGARDVDEDGLEFTRHVSFVCAGQGITVVSGGARGVDREAMFAALNEGGNVVGVIADSLSKTVVSRKYREAVKSGCLLLLSPFDPEAGFSVGNLMGRNRYIYTMADYALIISSSAEKGGTWTGVTENLKKQWIPVFVRSGENMPEEGFPDDNISDGIISCGNIPDGNKALIKMGCIPMDREATVPESKFGEWLEEGGKEFFDGRKREESSDKKGKESEKTLMDIKPCWSKKGNTADSGAIRESEDDKELLLPFNEDPIPKESKTKKRKRGGKNAGKAEQLSLPLGME